MTASLSRDEYRDVVRAALREDVGAGDVTSELVVPGDAWARGTVVARQPCLVCGLDVAAEVFRGVDAGVEFRYDVRDGSQAGPATTLATVTGRARSLLAAERTALNFLQRLSGIATLTRRFVEVAAGRTAILDTRKTTPGLRALEKYAVRVGGGVSHRAGLDRGILIKDNHIRLAGSVGDAVRRARQAEAVVARTVAALRKAAPDSARLDFRIEVEVRSLDDLASAIAAGADLILLDNMSPAEIRRAVAQTAGRTRLEVSGGVSLETLGDYAATGADYISVGALTHSAPAVDISLELDPLP